MDLRSYYRKLRDAESQLEGEFHVVVSEVTPEGGIEGVRTEVPRIVAAKLISEGRARIATEYEALEFHEGILASIEQFEKEEAAKRVHVMVIPSNDFKSPKERS